MLEAIWRSTLSEAEATYRQLYDRYVPLVQFYARLGIPLPRVLQLAAEFAINVYLRRALEDSDPSVGTVTSLLKQAQTANVPLDHEMLTYTFGNTIDRTAEALLENPEDLALLQSFENILSIVPMLPFEVDLWKAQNSYHKLRERLTPQLVTGAEVSEDEEARIAFLRSLGSRLRFREV